MNRTRVARAAGTALAVAAVTAATACAATARPTAAAPPTATAPLTTAVVPPPAAFPTPAPTAPVPPPPPALPAMVAGTYAQYFPQSGSTLLYVMVPGTAAWKLVGAIPQPTVNGSTQISFDRSRDLHRILLEEKSDHSLWNAALDGSDRHLVARPAKGLQVCEARFDERGDRVVYGVESAKGTQFALYTVKADGTDRRRVPGVTSDGACYNNASAANGSTVVFIGSYVDGLPVREYHEVKVYDGTGTREVVLHMSDKVHAGTVAAVSPDGRYAVIGGMAVRPDGSCGDGDDLWYVADLRTGVVTELAPKGGGSIADGAMKFDPSDHVLAVVATGVKVGKVYQTTVTVAVFDRHGRYVATLPNPSARPDGNVALWTVMA